MSLRKNACKLLLLGAIVIGASLLYGRDVQAQACTTGAGGGPICDQKFNLDDNADAPPGCKNGTSFCIKIEGCSTRVEAIRNYLQMLGSTVYGQIQGMTTNGCPEAGVGFTQTTTMDSSLWGPFASSVWNCGIQTITAADCFKSIAMSYVAALKEECSKPLDTPDCAGQTTTITESCLRPACSNMLKYLADYAWNRTLDGKHYITLRKLLYGPGPDYNSAILLPYDKDGNPNGVALDLNAFPPSGSDNLVYGFIAMYAEQTYMKSTEFNQECFDALGNMNGGVSSGAVLNEMFCDSKSPPGPCPAAGNCYREHHAMVLGVDACGHSFVTESTVPSGFSCYSTSVLGTTSGGGPGINLMDPDFCKAQKHWRSEADPGNCFSSGANLLEGTACVAGCPEGEEQTAFYYELPNSAGNPPTKDAMCGVATTGGCCQLPLPPNAPTNFPPIPLTLEEMNGWASGTSGEDPNVPLCRAPIGPGAKQPLRGDIAGAKGIAEEHLRKKTDVINPYEIFYHKDFYHVDNYTSACYYFNNLLSRVIKGVGWNKLGPQTNYRCGATGGYDPTTGMCFGGSEPLFFTDYDNRLSNINWFFKFVLQAAGDDQTKRESAYRLYDTLKNDLESQTQVKINSEIMEYLRRLEEQNKEYGVEPETSVYSTFLPFLGICPGLTARDCFEKMMRESGCESIQDINSDFVDDQMNLGCNDDDIAIRMGGKRAEVKPRVKGKMLPGVSHEETRRLTIACADHMIRSFRWGPPAWPGTVLENVNPANTCYKLSGQDRANCYAKELCQPLRIMSKALYEKSMGFSSSEHWPPGYCRVKEGEVSAGTPPSNGSPPSEFYTQRIQTVGDGYVERIMEPEPSAISAESYYYSDKGSYPKRDVDKMNEGWQDYREWFLGTQDLESLKDMPGTLCYPRPVAVLAKVGSVKNDLIGNQPEPNSTEMPETRHSRGRTTTNLWPNTDHSDAFSPRHQEDKFEYKSEFNDPIDMYPVCFVCGGNFQFPRNMMTPMEWEIKNYAKCIDCIRWCKNFYDFVESAVLVSVDGAVDCSAAWRETEDIPIGGALPYGSCCNPGGEGYCGESFVNQGPFTYTDSQCYTYEHANGNKTIDPINLPKSWFCHAEQYEGDREFPAGTKVCLRKAYNNSTLECMEWGFLEEKKIVHWTCPCPTAFADANECKNCNPRSVSACCEQNISPKVFPENTLNLAAFADSWGSTEYNQARITPDMKMQRLPYGGPDYKTHAFEYPVPEGFSFHEEFGKNYHCKPYDKRYRSDWCSVKSDANVPDPITGAPKASERKMPWLQWYQLNEISCKGYQDSIVGVGDQRQNCAYGGWEELKLYQHRCFRIWGVDCICDYEKTFKVGSAEENVLKEAGGYVEFSYSSNKRVNVNQRATHTPTADWPLAWRGYVSEPDIEYRFPASGLKEYYSKYANNTAGIRGLVADGILQPGLDYARAGDIIIWDRDVLWSTKPYNPIDLTVNEYDVLNEVMNDWRNNRSLSNSRFNDKGDFQGDQCGGEGENDRRISKSDFLGEGPLGSGSSETQKIMLPIENSRLPHVAFVSNANTKGALNKKILDAETKCAALREKSMMKMGQCDEADMLRNELNSLSDEKQYIEIVEANFGKNPDICGNTDRWGIKSVRRIYKVKKGFAMTSADLAESKSSCSDPENRNCHEALWDRVKVYHVGMDLRHSPEQ